MARLALVLLPLGVLGLFAACGDDSASGGSGPGSGPSGPVSVGNTTSTGTGSTNGGDCQTSTECMPGGSCVELTPGGFRTCQYPAQANTQCGLLGQGGMGGAGGAGGGGTGGSPAVLDECCEEIDDEDCGNNELCITTPLYPSCGQQEPPHNVCQDNEHECDNNANCSGGDQGPGFCIPEGTFGSQVRKCIRIACAADSECTAQPGGRCVPVDETCCPGAVRGLYCTYDAGGCRRDSDCSAGNTCQVSGGVASCQPGSCN